MSVATGFRMLVNYPTWMSRDDVQELIEDRQQALAFAESFLGVSFEGRITYRIETTLFAMGGSAIPSLKGGEIILYVPHGMFPQSDSRTFATMVGGCHEEAHLVSAFPFHWSEEEMLAVSPTLREGIAEWVTAEYTGVHTHRPAVAALLSSGDLHDLQTLLCPEEGSPFGLASRKAFVRVMNIYRGGAAFVEFLAESYDAEALLLMFSRSECPVDHLVVDIHDGQEIRLILPLEERRWHDWMSDWPIELAERGRHLLEITERLQSWEATVQLERTWQENPYELVGPSTHVATAYIDLIVAMNAFAASTEAASLAADAAALHARVDRLETLLTSWWDAVLAYEDALELAASGGAGDGLAELLEAAEDGYRTAGDVFMTEKCAAWLAELRGGSSD